MRSSSKLAADVAAGPCPTDELLEAADYRHSVDILLPSLGRDRVASSPLLPLWLNATTLSNFKACQKS